MKARCALPLIIFFAQGVISTHSFSAPKARIVSTGISKTVLIPGRMSYMRTDRGLNPRKQVYGNLGGVLESISRWAPGEHSDNLNFQNWTGKDVMDAGCGGGALVKDFRRLKIRAHGVDIVINEKDRKKPYFHEADLQSLPLKDESFDIVVSAYSVFHYPESEDFYTRVVSELTRVLRPGGYLILINTYRGESALFSHPELVPISEHLKHLIQAGTITRQLPRFNGNNIVFQKRKPTEN